MKSNLIVFVGGPEDGAKRRIPEAAMEWFIPLPPPPVFSFGCLLDTPPSRTKMRLAVYRRARLEGETKTVMAYTKTIER